MPRKTKNIAHSKPLFCGLFAVLLFLPFEGRGQSAWPCSAESDPEEVKIAIQEMCGSDFSCIAEHTSLLLTNESCFCRQIGQTLDVHFGFNLSEQSREEAARCETPYFLYPFTVASKAFGQANYDRAIDWYWEALSDGAPPQSCITNIGASYFQMGAYSLAFHCFEEAYDNAEPKDPEAFMILNNLTAIQMQLANWNDALQWSLLTKRRLAEQLDGYTPDQLTIGNAASAIAEANEWLIRIELDDREFIADHWKQVQWGSAHLPAEQWLKLILRTSEILGDERFYESNIRLVKQLYDEYLTQEQPSVTFGAYAWFLNRLAQSPARSFTDAIEDWKWVDLLYATRPIPGDSELLTPDSVAKAMARNLRLTRASWALAALLGLAFLGMIWRKKKNVAAHVANASISLENIKDWHLGKLIDFDVVQSSLEMIESTSRMNLSGWLVSTGVELSDAELIILRHAMANVSPKQTAAKHDWSPNYVYKIRSRLRVKLGAPEDADLNNWIHRQIKSS
jgi:DNA-binding CsgD family transcriptional regulator/tetratricopeptide (TPR) repeat protein